MILDNEQQNKKVHAWIAKYITEGKLDIVTGYFTIGALAYLSETVNQKISDFRMVLGDIVNTDAVDTRPLDLLNENITVEAALALSRTAQKAVEFLQRDTVSAKTLEPNFCHAKCYLFHPADHDHRNSFFISGSSNLTEAGIGLKPTSNVELNIAETGNNHQYQELVNWFQSLWTKPQAHSEKTITLPDGKTEKQNFKKYLIGEIERIFIKYTPKEIYYKILFEFFGDQLADAETDPEFNRQIGRLENTAIYNSLYDFQKQGVRSLIRMLQQFNGAILADAVGLGKTWTALAVIKFFQLQGRRILLLCPKKLEQNWLQYLVHQDSRFESDRLDFFIRFHTDMNEERMENYTSPADKFFTNDLPKLIVIDESHNLRNDKSSRYQFFLNKILKKNADVKVLLLSATPINNTLLDIRNQFKLMVQGNPEGFAESLGVKHLDFSFRTAQIAFNQWRTCEAPRIADLIKTLPPAFLTLTDSLTVSRTRKMIAGQEQSLVFPEKKNPENLFVTPHELGNFESFEELFKHFPPMLSGYQPSFYLEEKTEADANENPMHNEKLRERFLVKMLYILLVKRLESSWFAFDSTITKIKDHHQNALTRIKKYQEFHADDDTNSFDPSKMEDDELAKASEDFSLGKKRPVLLSQIAAAGKLDAFKQDLKKDLEALDLLASNLEKFRQIIQAETLSPHHHTSADTKLQTLIEKIKEKRLRGANNNNPKVVIFTVYRDTAFYPFDQLKARGFEKLAVVSGSGSRSWDSNEETKNFHSILERFAPYTKLFREKEWKFPVQTGSQQEYQEWIHWIATNDPKTYSKLQNNLDILIATDALSEGQNLQDADLVINYDIHWNPVRIIQRMGRIDRLGSPNKCIFGINFWPSENIDKYLVLKERIEQRMAAMRLAGAEVDTAFSESFKQMAEDADFEEKLNARMLKQMETTWDDIETNDQSLGFNDLSLESFRQELSAELNQEKDKYRRMPKGIYSGFSATHTTLCPTTGIIAFLGYPTRPPKATHHTYRTFDLVYLDDSGNPALLNQREVLEALAHHKDSPRFVPDAIDQGDPTAIHSLATALRTYIEGQATETFTLENGTTQQIAGRATLDVLGQIAAGNRNTIQAIAAGDNPSAKYQLKNFDLIAWLRVSEKQSGS